VDVGQKGMTESEWLTFKSPWSLHSEFLSILSDRKLRLFGAACLRRVWCLLGEATRLAVEATEDCTDGRICREELIEVWANAELDSEEGLWIGSSARSGCPCCFDSELQGGRDEHDIMLRYAREAEKEPAWTAAVAVFHALELVAWKAEADARTAAVVQEWRAQYLLWCDVFDAPRSPLKIDPAWRVWKDGTLRRLARSIYERRDFDHLPVLADALEDAGCSDAGMLLHCRSGGEHARGCWVVDRILGVE
jgi:hypothetical protein